jgi:hypothetical protein
MSGTISWKAAPGVSAGTAISASTEREAQKIVGAVRSGISASCCGVASQTCSDLPSAPSSSYSTGRSVRFRYTAAEKQITSPTVRMLAITVPTASMVYFKRIGAIRSSMSMLMCLRWYVANDAPRNASHIVPLRKRESAQSMSLSSALAQPTSKRVRLRTPAAKPATNTMRINTTTVSQPSSFAQRSSSRRRESSMACFLWRGY